MTNDDKLFYAYMSLSIVTSIVLAVTILFFAVSCSQNSTDDVPALIQEVAIDVSEEVIDEVVEHYSGVDPNLDFNGNDK